MRFVRYATVVSADMTDTVGDFEYDVFVSYNRKDASFVEFLIGQFERFSLRCFRDTTGLALFDKLDASLKSAIGKSRYLIAIISPSYLQSYWCLFEAIEAIQGQDREQRFLPLVLRYRPEDQRLDETFVLEALQGLDKQINDFETTLLKAKAFELSPKLDKLQFVRGRLPGVFRQLYERIFPEFELWDDRSVRRTLAQLIRRLAPESDVERIDSVPLTFDRLAATPIVVPRLRTLPSLVWKARVGHQTWKNWPLVVGNDVFVGSAGANYNSPDGEDGIYCLDAEIGAVKWFAATPADANRLVISKGVAITGCDDGTVMAVSARDGSFQWSRRLESGIVGGPIKLSADIGMSKGWSGGREQKTTDPVLVITYDGTVCCLDLGSGDEICRLELERKVIATPLVRKDGYRIQLAIPAIDGSLSFLEYNPFGQELKLVRLVTLRYADEYAKDGHTSVASLCAQPVFADGLILQGLVRQTSYPDPALIALDAASGQQRWASTDPDQKGGGFGNLRSAPVVVDGQVIIAPAYTSGLCAIDIDSGKWLWSVDLGQKMFEQWSSPVMHGQTVYIGRHDGFLHKVDVRRRRREWSMFLGSGAQAGLTIDRDQVLPEFDAQAAWVAAGSASILATPVIDRGRLYVGTDEGILYCLANLGNEDGSS